MVCIPTLERGNEEKCLSFELAEKFNFESALIWQDVRSDYGELRFNALGYINNRLYHMTFTPRGGAMRVISLRVEFFKASGKGWQTRMDDVLREYVASHRYFIFSRDKACLVSTIAMIVS